MGVLERIEHPIVLAPMGGGPGTVELAAAVAGAGALAFLASSYRPADGMRADIAALRERSRAPFGVNVFVPTAGEPDGDALAAYLERLGPEAERLGAAVGDARWDDDDWDAKLEALLADPVPLVSFTFGCPPAETIAALRDAGSEVWVTVTDGEEARLARDAGADGLVLQGVEAGGHRGCWPERGADAGLSTLALVRVAAAAVDLPLVAAGGLGDGAAVAAVLTAGAAAAALGTAFMLAPEAGTHPAHRAELATDRPTALTRAFSGRSARGIVNRFMVEHGGLAPVAYPHVNRATGPLRAAARERGDTDAFNLWAGQAHALARAEPAADIVARLVREAHAALDAAGRRLGP